MAYLAFVTTSVVAQIPQLPWFRVSPQGPLPPVHGAHYAHEQWVAVGQQGFLASSRDASLWATAQSWTDQDLNAVSEGGGVWLAVGDQAHLVSTNARDWVLHEHSWNLTDVSFGEGLWVSLSDRQILYSQTGIDWTEAHLPFAQTDEYHLKRVLYGNGSWVVVANYGQADNFGPKGVLILNSDNGTDWNEVLRGSDLETFDLDADYGGGRWIIVAGRGDDRFSPRRYETWTSTDGQTWSAIDTAGFTRVRFGPTGWIALSAHNQTFRGPFHLLWLSDDGLRWTREDSLLGIRNPTNIYASPETWLELHTASQNEARVIGPHSELIPVDSAQQVGSIPSGPEYTQIHCLGGFWLAGGYGHLAISRDGLEWRRVAQHLTTQVQILGMAYHDHTWIILGHHAQLGAYLLRSADTQNWEWIKLSIEPHGELQPFPRTVFYTGGEFQIYASAGGVQFHPDGTFTQIHDSRLLTSVDGQTWNEQQIEVPSGTMVFANGVYIVYFGNSHDLYVSDDGQRWSKTSLEGQGAIFDVTWGGERWLAAGASMFTSEDGYHWERLGNRPTFLTQIDYGNGQWYGATGLSRILASRDGAHWTTHFVGQDIPILTVTAHDDFLIATTQHPFLLAAPTKRRRSQLQIHRDPTGLTVTRPHTSTDLRLEQAPTGVGPWTPITEYHPALRRLTLPASPPPAQQFFRMAPKTE